MIARSFTQVDVFTDAPTRGNPVAVVHGGHDVADRLMQQFTDWTNLSEATFLLPPTRPEADYRLRIFCPGRELPFAGHPTLGSCHAWLEAGGEPQATDIVQECGAGLVRIRRSGPHLAFLAPPLNRTGPLSDDELDRIVRGLGISRADVVDHQWCDNGPSWQAVRLRDPELVLAVVPDPQVLAGLDIGVVGPSTHADADLEVRAFFPGNAGLTEDPVTGSLNAALGQWLIGSGDMPDEYTAAQGTCLGRQGRAFLSRQEEGIWVGGSCVTVVTGHVYL